MIAVILGEPQRNRIIEITKGNTLIGPGSIPWEIGNAFSAMFKQDRISLDDGIKALAIFESIPIKYCNVNFIQSIRLAQKENLYAYDAYFLDCSLRYNAPLLTLDGKLEKAATRMNVTVMEV